MSEQTISERIDTVRRPKRVTSTCPECKQRRHGPDAAFEDWEAARHPLELRLAALETENARLRDLVSRAVRSAKPRDRHSFRWGAVMRVFACGSTTAKALCREFGFDPDETKRGVQP